MPSPRFIPGPARGGIDPSSHTGACAMAERIRAAWAEVGYAIRVDVDSYTTQSGQVFSARVTEPVRF